MPTSSPRHPSHRASPSPFPSPSRPLPVSVTETLYLAAIQSFVRRDHVTTQSTLDRLLELIRRLPRADEATWCDLDLAADPTPPSRSASDGHGPLAPRNGEQDGHGVSSNGAFTGDVHVFRSSGTTLPTNGERPGANAPDGDEETITSDRLIQILKLVISSQASLYSDPLPDTSALDPELQQLLPPCPPNRLLEHLQALCSSFFPYHPKPAHPTELVVHLLPPALMSTLILACLKCRPEDDALSFAHRVCEDWLAALPDEFVFALSPRSDRAHRRGGSEEGKRRVESAKEGYSRVLELFVGEVLGREGEWEMAKGLLEGEVVMGSKRKENLYKHLRALQTRKSNPSSPASSTLLTSPSSSVIIPSSPTTRPNGHPRSRSSSTSSSSSELTARPNLHTEPALTKANGLTNGNSDRKGKARAPVQENPRKTASTTSSTSLPSKIYVNPPREGPDRRSGLGRRGEDGETRTNLWERFRVSLPFNFQDRLLGLTSSSWLAALSVPVPIMIVLLVVLGLRRRMRRQASPSRAGAVVGSATVATQAVADVQERLRLARGRGAMEWVGWWLRWWVGKLVGVWKLGTTITYV